MKQAILSAIYYTNNPLLYHPVITLSYVTPEDFKKLLSYENTHTSVKFKQLFGTCDISYQILDQVSQLGDELLTLFVKELYIITRNDMVIKVTNTSNKISDNTVAIIKLDAVLADLNINNYMETKNNILVTSIIHGYTIVMTGLISYSLYRLLSWKK
jgi:hypothetical protein